MRDRTTGPSRRQILIGAGALAGAGLLPALIHSALAQDAKGVAATLQGLKPAAVKPPAATFLTNPGGALGPWGEVRVGRTGALALPTLILSADKLGVVDLSTKRPFVQLGNAGDPIVWTSAGVIFRKGTKPEPWSAATIARLRKTITADRGKTRALMQLRAALVSAYPVYLATAKAQTDKKLVGTLARAQSAISSTHCTTRNVEEEVTRQVITLVETWRTAERQYEQCFDRETSGDPDLGCSYLPAGFARNSCAAAVCAARGFVDILLSVTQIVTTITETVVREVVVCIAAVAEAGYRNTWTLVDTVLPGLEKPGAAVAKFLPQDLQAGLKFLQDASAALGPFAKCLLGAKWSIESVGTPLRMGDGNLAIPYGVRACMSAACARNLTIPGVGAELVASWTAAITLLAALSADFAAIAAGLGVAVPAALAAAVAALPPVAAAAAAIILAFVILALIYGTALTAQLTIAEAGGAFADGEVCIVHPTIALAMVKALMLGNVPAELVPPIVVG